MKRKNRKPSVRELTSDEISAILYALPLIWGAPETSAVQDEVNRVLSLSASKKLAMGKTNFTANELRVIAASVLCACEYLAGHLPDLQPDKDTDAELRKHLFTFNRLRLHFAPFYEAPEA